MPGIFEGVRVVGAGQTAYAKKSPKSVQRLLYADAFVFTMHHMLFCIVNDRWCKPQNI